MQPLAPELVRYFHFFLMNENLSGNANAKCFYAKIESGQENCTLHSG